MKRGLIIDFMCGKLAKWLRFMGIDTLYVKESDPSIIENLALKTGRIIVTRSHKFKDRKKIAAVVLEEENLENQIIELSKKIDIKDNIKLLGRCSLCNSLLIQVEKESVKGKVPQYVFETQEKFFECSKCKKIYWQGTHYENIKKRIDGIFTTLLLISLLFYGCSKKALYKTNERSVPVVRVLIAEELTSITFHSSKPIIVTGVKDHFIIQPFDTFSITKNDNFCFPLLLDNSVNSPIFVNGIGYIGKIKVYLDSDLKLINFVDMETYIKGVVPHEIGTRTLAELEAVKAQAVAARTYALKHLNLYTRPLYDLVSTVYDQIYKGIQHRYAVSDSAVKETYGKIITYKGMPVEAKYSSTCGGRTSDARDNWGQETISYLRSIRDGPNVSLSKDNAFCSISPLFTWKRKYLKEEFYKMLKRNLSGEHCDSVNKEIGNITMLRIERNPRSKRVTKLTVETETGEFIFYGLDIRKALKDGDKILWSNYFYIETNKDTTIIQGKGAGHGCGMCQWGAIGMARKGFHYDEILKHYYRGTSVKKIY